MPTLRCPSCGQVVRFEGIAGVCPNCAAIVRAVKLGDAKQPIRASEKNPNADRGRHTPVDLKDIQELDSGEEVFEPSNSMGYRSNAMAGLASLDRRLLFSIIGAFVIVAIFGLYVVLRRPTPDDAKIQPAPPPLSYSYSPPPKPQAVVPSNFGEVPQPTSRPTDTAGVPKPATQPAWVGVRPIRPTPGVEAINDQLVEASIKRAVQFLKSQFKDGSLIPDNDNPESVGGGDALAVYALLHAGQAVVDPDLSSGSDFVRDILERVKRYEMNTGKPVYDRSLRLAALSMLNRAVDRDQLFRDRQWLLRAETNGAYGYDLPAAGTKPEDATWDNSTSQYGVLGIWAAVVADGAVPDKYWADVEKHWLSCQTPEGGWGYHSSGSTPAMTCAGVTTLCVAAEFGSVAATTKVRPNDIPPAFSLAVNKGVDFLAQGDVILNLGAHPGYSLYAVERAALATGLRWFGNHDWYRELGAKAVREQKENGSWEGADRIDIETAFTLLFLSRGRQPLLMDKLRFAGNWNNRSRDVSKLAQFASAQLEKPFAWSVADLNRDWWDWLESPVLFISTDAPPTFSDDDCDKLRSYADAGGLIFIHNEFGSKAMDSFVADLSHRLFPNYPMIEMSPEDLLYSCVFPMKAKPAMRSVSNGSRTLLIYSPKDITQEWVRYRPRDSKDSPALQLGLNLFVDGAGKTDFRNRLSSPYVGPVVDPPLATVPIYQIAYPGPWNPEPGAWLRFPRWFQKQTSLALDVQRVDIRALNFKHAPVAMLTGNTDYDFSKLDTHALRDYVNQGGVLIIDSAGGNKAFAGGVREVLLPTTFPGIIPTGIPSSHPILSGANPCTDPLPKPRLRSYSATLLNGVAPSVQYASFGKGTIIISDLDLTTGLLDSSTFGIYGYSPAYCQSLVKNVILWALSQYHI